MANAQPKWADKLGVDDKTTFAKPTTEGTFFKRTEMPRSSSAVKVVGKIRRADVGHQLLLQLPATVSNRIAKAINGASGPGLVALIEYALDQLDSNSLSIIVENRE